ncbi:hypothetical protein CBF29_09415 [Vagococcus elongatus]|uniref:Glucokinase n=1 Tax=Vagococcus elongatus TaxID=180344 RepID=A0A430AQV1_9ENTE|nr:ROK family glucokinase [Vagococcus elongatus]RSU10502.1 hypothetical protein CBF29_09415 [Vagococcus elongatus]
MTSKFLGIDIGGTSIKLGIVTGNGDIVEKWQISTNRSESGNMIIKDIVNSISGKIFENKLKISDFSGIGIGVPGPVEGGRVKRAVNLGWKDMPLVEIIQQSFNLPVQLINDANAAALGELWIGSKKGMQDVVFVTLGTGVGGGIVVNGKIINGANASGGEIGHIPLITNESRICSCGNINCLECYASANGLFHTMKNLVNQYDSMLKFSNTADIFELSARGNLIAHEAIETTISYLAYALSSIINTLDPEEVIIGGGLSDAGEALLLPLRKSLKPLLFPQIKDNLRLRKASVGNDAGVLGAVYQVIQEQKL